MNGILGASVGAVLCAASGWILGVHVWRWSGPFLAVLVYISVPLMHVWATDKIISNKKMSSVLLKSYAMSTSV